METTSNDRCPNVDQVLISKIQRELIRSINYYLNPKHTAATFRQIGENVQKFVLASKSTTEIWT